MLSEKRFEELLGLMISTAKDSIEYQIQENLKEMGMLVNQNRVRYALIGTLTVSSTGKDPIGNLEYAIDSLTEQKKEIDDMANALRAAYRVLVAAREVE